MTPWTTVPATARSWARDQGSSDEASASARAGAGAGAASAAAACARRAVVGARRALRAARNAAAASGLMLVTLVVGALFVRAG